MADVLTKEQRKFNMSRIRDKDTQPEILLRKYLFSRGLRYRKNDKCLPGKPDIVFPKYRTVVFMNGCFWHRHPGCRYATNPSSNAEFWQKKFKTNVDHDQKVYEELKQLGWHIIIVWECELKKAVREETCEKVYEEICKGVDN